MWHRTLIIIVVLALSVLFASNFSKSAYSKTQTYDCQGTLTFDKVYDGDIIWIYVYCDGLLIDKYIQVE